MSLNQERRNAVLHLNTLLQICSQGWRTLTEKGHAELREQIATLMEHCLTFCGFAPENLYAFPEVRLC